MTTTRSLLIPRTPFIPNGLLRPGARMTQPEFHRRYEQMPDGVTFELVGGVVYMASPVRQPHGGYVSEFSIVLGHYKAGTPGTDTSGNVTTILGDQSEPQPDEMLRITKEYGGQSHINEEQYLVGAPELVVEVAHSSRSIDLGGKKADYKREGVREYVVFSVPKMRLFWFHFRSGKQLKPDKHGIWRSREFPGLWIDGPALAARDTARLIEVVQQGMASPEHAKFVKKLEQARKRRL